MNPETNHESPDAKSFHPAVDVESLLQANSFENDAEPIEQEDHHYEQIVNFLNKQRQDLEILDESGQLDTKEKFDKSAYEIFNLNYYKKNVYDQQGVQMPKQETDEELRELYVLKTQQLIEKIIESDTEILFFLDKSARPVSWLLKEMWPLFAPEDKALPARKFLSIEANEIMHRGPDDPRPTPEEILDYTPGEAQVSQVHDIYTRETDSGTVDVPEHPGQFTRGMIIDEVSVTGATLEFAHKIINASFPDMKVETAHWMSANVQPVGRRGYEAMATTQLPPWYNKNYIEGRGIGDTGSNPMLSEPHPAGPTEIITEALRTDIQLLGKDIKEGKQSVRPLIGCYETDPATGKEDLSKPKYKLARFDKDRNRIVTPPYHEI